MSGASVVIVHESAGGLAEVTCVDCDGLVAVVALDGAGARLEPDVEAFAPSCTCERGARLFLEVARVLGASATTALCGEADPAHPAAPCALPSGHESEHVGQRPDGIWTIWPRAKVEADAR